MSLDFNKEHPITLAEVPRHVPKRNGKKVHYSTVYRWISKGARGRILESACVGGVRFTTVEAVARFLSSNTSAPTSENQPLEAAIEAALKKAGV